MSDHPPEFRDNPIIDDIRSRYDEIKESMITGCGRLHNTYPTDAEIRSEEEEKMQEINDDDGPDDEAMEKCDI